MPSLTHKKRKARPRSGMAKRARKTTPRSVQVTSHEEKPAPPRTPLFHPLAAELASSIDRDAGMMARVAAQQLAKDDPLVADAKQLATLAKNLWRELVARTGAEGARPYIGSASDPLRVLKEEDVSSSGVSGRPLIRRPRNRVALAPDELRYLPLLKASIYAPAWRTMGAPSEFAWRRANDGALEALRLDSSQVLAVSLWGVASQSESQAVRELLEFHTSEVFRSRSFNHKPLDIWVRYEPRPTELRKASPTAPRLGVVVGAPDTICVVETETIDRSHQCCPAFVSGRCDGSVANSGRGCPLDVDVGEDAFPYQRIKNLLKMGTLEDGRPCPFANDNFHNMRVVFAAATLEPREGTFAVVFCHVGSWNPASAEGVAALKNILWDVYGDRVVAVDLDDVVDDLIGSEDPSAADLGIFLWKRIRALGATQLTRLIARALPEPADDPTPQPTTPKTGSLSLRLKMPVRLPLIPHDRRGHRELVGSQHEADVVSFVHPRSGAEAFVTSNRYGMRIRVPLSANGEELVRAALAALATEGADPVAHGVFGDYAFGSVQGRAIDAEPARAVLQNAGFIEEQW